MMTLKKKYSRKMLNDCSSFKEYIHIERYMNMIIVYHMMTLKKKYFLRVSILFDLEIFIYIDKEMREN